MQSFHYIISQWCNEKRKEAHFCMEETSQLPFQHISATHQNKHSRISTRAKQKKLNKTAGRAGSYHIINWQKINYSGSQFILFISKQKCQKFVVISFLIVGIFCIIVTSRSAAQGVPKRSFAFEPLGFLFKKLEKLRSRLVDNHVEHVDVHISCESKKQNKTDKKKPPQSFQH